MKFICFLLIFVSTYSFAQKSPNLLSKGITAFEKGQHSKAERYFDKILVQANEGSGDWTTEDYAETYRWKGKCLQEFEDYQAAYEHFSTACNLLPQNAIYWLEMGKFKYHIGMTSIRKPELCGSCGKTILPESNAAKASDYYKSALIDYKKALLYAPKFDEAHYHIALNYEALGQKEQACYHLQQASNLNHPLAVKHLKTLCP